MLDVNIQSSDKYFYFRYTKYVWVPHQNSFTSLDDSIQVKTTENLLQDITGLYFSDAKKLLVPTYFLYYCFDSIFIVFR